MVVVQNLPLSLLKALYFLNENISAESKRRSSMKRFCQELLIHPSQKDPEPDALGASSATVPSGKGKVVLLHLS